MSRHPEVDLAGVTLLSVKDRATKVGVEQFGRAPSAATAAAASQVIDGLPDVLAGRVLRDAVEAVVASHAAGRPVVLLAGAHVVKVGVQPFLVPLIERGVVTHVGLHGAGAIHDVEVALFGTTSEDVEANLASGAFGMVRETPEFFHAAAAAGRARGEGLGEALGRALVEAAAPHGALSLLAAAWRSGIPATVHVALGTDTIHTHPAANGADLGETSLRDFRILAHTLLEARGATVLNLGSAVILPEVFLKALTVAVNLGATLADLTTINVDQLQHYRTRMNVLERPTRAAGARGLSLTGHHEILLPLLAQAVLARIDVGPEDASRRP
jgi:GNAT superfamily N-acetyltransferase